MKDNESRAAALSPSPVSKDLDPGANATGTEKVTVLSAEYPSVEGTSGSQWKTTSAGRGGLTKDAATLTDEDTRLRPSSVLSTTIISTESLPGPTGADPDTDMETGEEGAAMDSSEASPVAGSVALLLNDLLP